MDEKTLKISTQRIERAWEDLRKHVLMGPLVQRARLKIIDYQPQVPAMFVTVAESGEIYANPFNHPRTPQEWVFVLAHALLHLAFRHIRQARRGIVWNIACDCVVNEFLSRMKIGTPPEGLLRLPSGVPNDEEKLFTIWTQSRQPPQGETTNGTAMDMVATSPGKANWPDIFARAIRRAAQKALSAAAGPDDEVGLAQQARSWFVKNYPLLGAVLQHFKIVENARLCERLGVRVGAVNPQRRELILNPGWAMSPEEYRYVLAHMALHAGLQHVQRRRGRDPFLWNAACDYRINAWLNQIALLQRMCKPPGQGLLLSPDFARLSAEDIYEELLRNEKAARKLVTFAGEGVPDCIFPAADSHSAHSLAADQSTIRNPQSAIQQDRVLLDALLRGYQIHSESGKGALPHTLIDEIRALEHPPLPWDEQLGRWFDKHVPPVERVRTYARPSRRQSATPQTPRPRYIWPDEETAQRGTFGIVLDSSGRMEAPLVEQILSAISMYALSRNIPLVRFVTAGADVRDLGMTTASELNQRRAPSPIRQPKLKEAVELLENARDFPGECPLVIITALPCERITASRTHCFLVRGGGRLPFKTDSEVIEVIE
jgi:predicted metal-dependent peptidase